MACEKGITKERIAILIIYDVGTYFLWLLKKKFYGCFPCYYYQASFHRMYVQMVFTLACYKKGPQ